MSLKYQNCISWCGCWGRTPHQATSIPNASCIQEHCRAELEYMLEHNIIENSVVTALRAPRVFLFPSQVVHLGFVQIFAMSMQLPKQTNSQKYVSKFDLLKGYWQVPLTERAKEISAFVTPKGFHQCKVMPFGLKMHR